MRAAVDAPNHHEDAAARLFDFAGVLYICVGAQEGGLDWRRSLGSFVVFGQGISGIPMGIDFTRAVFVFFGHRLSFVVVFLISKVGFWVQVTS
ncbi:hypothetical protein GCK32_019213, partial [Trichostrongylus colubriformis]